MTKINSRAARLAAILAVWMGLAAFSIRPAQASEGGGSDYLQGTYNDFGAGIIGPEGFYFRDDLFRYSASVGPRPLGGLIQLGADQVVWANAFKFAYVSDIKILGGTYSAAVALPVIINAAASGVIVQSGFSQFKTGSTGGIGDTFILPFQLNWTRGKQHFNFAQGIDLPSGSYDKDRILKTGRNYFAFDPALAYTWLDPKRGQEVSFTSGVMFNTRNPATEYRTGKELHLDWNIAQHFSATFAIGLDGYWYKQLTADDGTLPFGFSARNFTADSAGLAPAIVKSVKIHKMELNLIAKWLGDIETKDRFKGNLLMFSVAMKL